MRYNTSLAYLRCGLFCPHDELDWRTSKGMDKRYDTKEMKVLPLSGGSRRPLTVRWGFVYICTAVFVIVFTLVFNFIFVLYPDKVESYDITTSIDTTDLLFRLSQIKAQATPELRVYAESSDLALTNLKIFHEEDISLREANELPAPILSPADAEGSSHMYESASYRNPADIATELSTESISMMDVQGSLDKALPRIRQDSNNIAWYKTHTPSRFPLRGTDNSDITSGYGWRIHPVYGYPKPHDGVDIHAPFGTDILAVADGVVTRSQYFGGYGYMVEILHRRNPEIRTRYGHVTTGGLLVDVGDSVKRGDLIALVGSTGVSTGPHVHFEVRINGKHTDPEDYIRKNWHCGGFPALTETNDDEEDPDDQ